MMGLVSVGGVKLGPECQALAWALVHFLWQGLILWAVTALAFRLARRRSAQCRYALGCVALLLALACPVATYFYVRPDALAKAALDLQGMSLQELENLAATLANRESLPLMVRVKLAFQPWLPIILAAWVMGSGMLALRLLGGWIWMQRLRRKVEPLESYWESKIQALARSMGLQKTIFVAISHHVDSPLVIGWLRPIILIPAACLLAMEPLALESLLVHELAHIRRRDYLVNLVQSFVEVLLFYHPAIWWISRRVRTEREACCDDAAVAHTGDPLHYAETLNLLDDLRLQFAASARKAQAAQADYSLAQQARGGTLMLRISRLLNPSQTQRTSWALPALALSLVTAAVLTAQNPTPAASVASKDEKIVVAAPEGAKAKRMRRVVIKSKKDYQDAEQRAEMVENIKDEIAKAREEASDAKDEVEQPKSGEHKTVTYRSELNRQIRFTIRKTKEGLIYDLGVTNASRDEIIKALEKIEILSAGVGERNVSGWLPFKSLKKGQTDEDLISFSFDNVTLEGIRKTL